MWFRNALIYRLVRPLTLDDDRLQEQLATHLFRGCGSQDSSALGWVPPLPEGELLYHRAGQQVLFCQRRQQKVLPAGAVNEKLEEKVRDIEQSEGRSVYRKERQQLKEELMQTLLPRALTRSRRCYAWLDEGRQLLVIDSSNRTHAEELMNSLRECLGSLPVIPLTPRQNPETAMTDWVTGASSLPANLALGRSCDLRDPLTQSNVIRARDQDLNAEELHQHLDHGKQVFRLALCWNEAIEFTLHDDGSLRGLKFSDALREDAEDAEDARARFDQSFAVMTLELGHCVEEVVAALGGPAE